jgi:ribosomal protein L40E
MKNKIICENCNSENDFFNLNCNNCGSLLRDKKPNIDLFATVWALIEEPTKSLRKIVFAEHKNYQFFVLLLLLLKLVFTSFFLQSLIISPVDFKY